MSKSPKKKHKKYDPTPPMYYLAGIYPGWRP